MELDILLGHVLSLIRAAECRGRLFLGPCCRNARHAAVSQFAERSQTRNTQLMGSANLEFVRSLFEPWQRGDFSSVEWAHPDIELLLAGGPDEGSWTGLAGLAEGWRRFVSTWEAFRADPEEYKELDAERVLVLARWRGHGKTSGVDIGQVGIRAAVLLHNRGDKVTRLVLYWDRDRALSDLGVAPEANSARS